MTEDMTLDIIKGALILEQRGKALYESAVKTTQVEGIKNLFSMLVREEEKHITLLSRQFKNLVRGKNFNAAGLQEPGHETSGQILSKEIAEAVSGAGYESAVISAALEFEKNAVKYYSEKAQKSLHPEEKKLFEWLAKWEKTHMHILAEIDNEIKEKIWFDNSFWPLD